MRRALALLAACAACRKTPPPPPPEPPAPQGPVRVAEQEPNDFQHAQAIPSLALVTGSLAAPRDDDWYRVAGARLALRVELRGVRDASLELYDRDRNRVLRVHAGGEDPGVIPKVACIEACFLRVSGAGPQEYELSVAGAAPAAGQELEPNDRAVDANELQPGLPMQGTYLSGEDEDWYRLALDAGPADVLRVEVTAVPGVRPELEVRSLGDGAPLATFRANEALYVRDLSLHLGQAPATPDAGVANVDAGVGDAGAAAPGAEGPDAAAGVDAGLPGGGAPDALAAAAVAAPVPGYFLVLKGRSRHGAPLVPYTLTASVETGAPGLEEEPNDDPQHANPIHETAVGYLAPAGDQDWFRIHTDAPAVLHAELSGADRADLELAVYGPGSGKPALLARVNEVGPREVEVVPAVGLPAGDSYLLVQSAPRQLEGKWVRDAEDRQNPYRLMVRLSPDDGSIEREPDNDAATAQVLALPIAVKGFIWPRKDVDFFRFHVEAGHKPVSIFLSAVRGVDLALRLYQLHGDQPPEIIGSSDAARGEGEEKLVSVPLKEGDYAVEVQSPRNKDASASEPYTLRVQ
jgi:pre-peptidase